jgi:hypothetical protein
MNTTQLCLIGKVDENNFCFDIKKGRTISEKVNKSDRTSFMEVETQKVNILVYIHTYIIFIYMTQDIVLIILVIILIV